MSTLWLRLNRVVLGVFFLLAGANHFVHQAFYVAIMPPSLPNPVLLVQISGVCEMAGGVGIFVPALRRGAGWGLMALLVAVFPANVHMAVNHVSGGLQASPLSLWLRLPLQPLMIYWVWWCTRQRDFTIL